VHGAAGALLYALARRLAGAPLAVAAVALEIAFLLPVAPGRGAPFNVPYPAWYAGLAGVAVALLVPDARPARIVLAGALAGLTFAVKPNSGLLLAAGAAAAVALDAGGAAARAVCALVALAAAALVAPTGLSMAAAVLVPPVAALALVAGPRAGDGRTLALRLTLLAAGFVAVGAVAFASALGALGPARFGSEVLLVGSGVAELYALPFPWPAALAAAAGIVAFVLGGGTACTLAAGAALAVAFAAGAFGGAPSLSAVRLGAEIAALALAPLALWAALAELRGRADAALAGPAAVATLAAVQLYPRPDFIHLMPLGALFVPLALRAWRRVPVPAALLIGLPLLVAAGRFLPTAAVLARITAGRLVGVDLGATRLVIEPESAAPLRAVATAAAAVRATPDGEGLLAFPACGLVPFVASRSPVGPDDYFFPGRPTRAEAAELVERLAAAPPRFAVTCDAGGTPLAAAWGYYLELVTFLRGRYTETVAAPPFAVAERR
jgi:hypothetical protein